MANTYCGKSCETCSSKEKLNCSGCKTGRGNYMTGICEIAACCRAEACNKCTECSMVDDCKLFASSGQSSETRLSRTSEESIVTDYDLKKARFLGDRIFILFCLSLASFILPFLKIAVAFIHPSLYLFMSLVGLGLQIALIVLYFIIGKYEDNFRYVFWLNIAAIVNSVLSIFFAETALEFLFTLASLAIVLAYISCEAKGFAAILMNVDIYLSEKWDNYLSLFKKGVIATIITAVSLIVLIFVPCLLIVGYLAIIALSIFLIVLLIVRLVYIAQTANSLKNFYRKNS